MWCPEVGLGVEVSRGRFRFLASRGCSTASRGDLQDLGMSRSGVFAIRVGYEGEGGTALREQSLTERQPDNSDVSLTVLIIYNMGAREKWIKDRSQGCRPKNIIFAHVQKTYENPMDFNHFSFRPNSPRELSFYFCHTYNAF